MMTKPQVRTTIPTPPARPISPTPQTYRPYPTYPANPSHSTEINRAGPSIRLEELDDPGQGQRTQARGGEQQLHRLESYTVL